MKAQRLGRQVPQSPLHVRVQTCVLLRSGQRSEMEVSWAALPLEALGEGPSCLSQLLGPLGLCLHVTSSSMVSLLLYLLKRHCSWVLQPTLT